MVGFGTFRDGHQHRIDVAHVMAADDVGAVGEPAGCWSLAERSSRAAELIAPQDNTTMSAEYFLAAPLRSTITFLISGRRAGFQPFDIGLRQQGDIRVLDGGIDGNHLGVGFGMDQAGEAVAGVAADAAAVVRILRPA